MFFVTSQVADERSWMPSTARVEDGRTGKLFEPGNVDALSGTIHGLLGDGGERSRLAENGLRYAKDSFTIDRMIREYEQLYDRV